MTDENERMNGREKSDNKREKERERERESLGAPTRPRSERNEKKQSDVR